MLPPSRRSSQPHAPSGSAPSGASLVLVLAALALVSFLALAILTFVRAEGRSALTSAELVDVRMLAQVPEKLVLAQLKHATSQLGTEFTWASQPGMIRVFDNTAPESPGQRTKPFEIIKLYSDDRMIVSSPTSSHLDEDTRALDSWAANKAQFVDLNEPVRVLPVRKQGAASSSAESRLVFPIVDPRAFLEQLVDGFTTATPPGLNNNAATAAKSPYPMPVSWLYVLRDGSIAAPSGSNGPSVRVVGASEDNPIVGRIAFWTDDESCKLNLNTATEPSPWQAPLTKSIGDEANAASIPAKNEFYRMSGHPAYTSLAPVLRHLGGAGNTGTEPKREPQDARNDTGWWRHLSAWHDLMPRSLDLRSYTGTQGGGNDATDEVTLKESRLFQNVDELYFLPGTRLADGRPLWQGSGMAPKFTPEDLRKIEFFVTPHSRAPELNPFNRPKISLWPVQQTEGRRSTLDNTFVDASSLAGDIYFLQRYSIPSEDDPGSSQRPDQDASIERNQAIFGYLQSLTELPIPGFGGQFAERAAAGESNLGKYSELSRDQLLTSMFDLVRWGVNPYQPSFNSGSSLLDEHYSYLTSGNGTATYAWSAAPMRVLRDDTQSDPNLRFSKGFGRFPTITEVCIVFAAVDATPELSGTTYKYGTDDWADKTTKVQAFVVIEPFIVAPGVPSVSPRYIYRIEGLNSLGVDGDSLGLPADAYSDVWLPPNASIASATFDTPTGNSPSFYSGGSSPFAGFPAQFLYFDATHQGATPRVPLGPDPMTGFPFVSSTPVTLKTSDGQQDKELNITGAGKIVISIYDGATDYNISNAPVQRIEVDISSLSKIPVPLIHRHHESTVRGLAPDAQMAARFKLRRPGTNPVAPETGTPFESAQMRNLIHAGDVTRSFEPAERPAGGDVRIIAGRPEITAAPNNPSNLFKPHAVGDYDLNNPGVFYRADSLRDGAHMMDGQVGLEVKPPATTGAPARLEPPATGYNASRIVVRPTGSDTFQALPYDDRNVPASTSVAMNLDHRAGDFDTGPGIIEDGPYINPPGFNTADNQRLAGSTISSQEGGWFQRGGFFNDEEGPTWSALRYASSGFLFGSLPTAVFGLGDDASMTPRPWQTLLLCPNPASRTTPADGIADWQRSNTPTTGVKQDHVGFKSPSDHLWLEFFWLPTVEPKGLCDGFATEGKVNMNFQMQPFTWIERATALHGAMHGVRVTAIPSQAASSNSGPEHYKNPTATSPLSFRYAVDVEKTLEGFRQRFNAGDLFRSPSEICDIFLVPKRIDGHTYEAGAVNGLPPIPASYDKMMDWWEGADKNDPSDAFEATGDNAREAPYAQLYPRLCTKSNVFTVHWRVQVLRKSRSTNASEWNEDTDRVVAEQRGQSMVERHLPPNFTPQHTKPSDFVTTLDIQEALDDYYEYRVVNRRTFAP